MKNKGYSNIFIEKKVVSQALGSMYRGILHVGEHMWRSGLPCDRDSGESEESGKYQSREGNWSDHGLGLGGAQDWKMEILDRSQQSGKPSIKLKLPYEEQPRIRVDRPGAHRVREGNRAGVLLERTNCSRWRFSLSFRALCSSSS